MSIGTYVEEHPALSFGIAFVGALVIWTVFSKKHGAAGSTASDLSGVATDASGNRVVYVPTQTSFSTSNIGADFSNDPNLQNIQTGAIVTNSPISASQQTSTSTTTVNPPRQAPPPIIITKPSPPPPIEPPPAKLPAPAPAPHYAIQWNWLYTVQSGDTLSKIAGWLTDNAHRAGMPNNMAITWQMIYGYNKAVIDSTSAAHGNPIPGGPWNNIFPGEKISLAGWTKIS